MTLSDTENKTSSAYTSEHKDKRLCNSGCFRGLQLIRCNQWSDFSRSGKGVVHDFLWKVTGRFGFSAGFITKMWCYGTEI